MPKLVDVTAQRRRIATAAIAVIKDSGLDGARLRDVARAAQLTTGAVTHYFEGKDAVLEAALEEIVTRTLGRIGAPLAPEAPRTLAAFVERASRFLPLDEASREEWRVWLAFWGRAIAEERLRLIHCRYYAALGENLARAIEDLLPGTSVAPERVRPCADAVLAAIDGVGTRATLEPESWPAERQRATLAALLLPTLEAFVQKAAPEDRPSPDRTKAS